VIEILEPLSQIPGVRYAGLVTHDGVPIFVPGARAESAAAAQELDGLSALASQWFTELSRQAGELTWDAPVRAVMIALRGSLVLRQVKGGLLMALLDEDAAPEQLRLPMDGAAARLQRVLRSMGGQVEPLVEPPPVRSLKPNQHPAADQAKRA
jgi:predicted regulator of Ras-like GTPase activity (Roadblock/LC7/MglB family)